MTIPEARKLELSDAIEEAVAAFLKEHPDLRYYCFAFDCNAEYAEINLCFNTEEAFQETLRRYQKGPCGDRYRSEETAWEVRYDPGDWDYQCFDTFYVLDEDQIRETYGEDDERLTAEMMALNYQLLALFCQTETFRHIPKTEGFRVLCIDHDATLEDAIRETDERISL